MQHGQATCCLHRGEPEERYAVCRRHVEFAAKSLATSGRRRWRLYETIRVQDACLVRVAFNNARSDRSRKADQKRIEKKKTRIDRGNKPQLARFVRGVGLRRHCERSEAIQVRQRRSGLLRRYAPRNDGSVPPLARVRMTARTSPHPAASRPPSLARGRGVANERARRR
jgi:hypothetical protein